MMGDMIRGFGAFLDTELHAHFYLLEGLNATDAALFSLIFAKTLFTATSRCSMR